MKVLHITDSHGTIKSPQGRKDIYYVAFLRKLYELGYVIRNEKIKAVIHTGDLFHTPNVSDKFTGQVSEIIKSWGIPVYVVPGNHDIIGYTIDTIDQTKLGLLRKAGVVLPLDRNNPIRWNIATPNGKLSVAVSGQEYYENIDTGNQEDFEMQQAPADINILCIHGYIADKPQHPNIRHTLPANIFTDADIILSGHYHNSFHVDMTDFSVFNPGSMMRVEQNEYNRTHIPQYGILDLYVDETGDPYYEYTFHNFKTARPGIEVFDYNAQAQQKSKQLSLSEFNAKLDENNVNTIASPHEFLNIVKSSQVEQPIRGQAIYYISEAKKIKDVDDSAKNYTVSTSKVRIKEVIIENFQSHRNTHIMLEEDGLNIITGENNEGKTSILRAILWVLTGRPSGSEFITTGETSCKVSLVLSTGVTIIRERTRKSAGKYSIIPDANSTDKPLVLSGFGSTIPYNVYQASQMPPIEIEGKRIFANVITQFDSAFFVSDSPSARAKIIGKISGVDIADSAIKLINKKAKEFETNIKVEEGQLDSYYKELKLMPQVTCMEKIHSVTEGAMKYVGKEQKFLASAGQIAVSFDKAVKSQKENEKRKELYETVLLAKPIVDDTNALLNDVKIYQGIIDNHNAKQAELKEAKDRVSSADNILRMKKIENIYRYIKSLSEEIEILQRYNNDILALKDTSVDLVNEVRGHEWAADTMKHMIALMSAVVDSYRKYDGYNQYVKEAEALKTTKQDIDDCLYNINITIKKAEKDREALTDTIIKANGDVSTCPCCGQAIKTKIAKKKVMDYIGG